MFFGVNGFEGALRRVRGRRAKHGKVDLRAKLVAWEGDIKASKGH